MTFGGVPIGVANPPIDAENEVINISPVAYLGSNCDEFGVRSSEGGIDDLSFVPPSALRIPPSFPSTFRIDNPMANIIAVVAVLLIQAETNAVVAPNANRTRDGLPPTQRRVNTRKASRRSSPCNSIARASMNEPMNKNIN